MNYISVNSITSLHPPYNEIQFSSQGGFFIWQQEEKLKLLSDYKASALSKAV